MIKFDVVPFRLGVGSSEPLGATHLKFYRQVAELVDGGPAEAVDAVIRPLETMSAEIVIERPQSIYDPLTDALDKVGDQADLTILDLSLQTGSATGAIGGTAYLHAASAAR